MREAVIDAFGKKEGDIVDISGSEIDDPDFWKELYEETDDLSEKDRTTFRYTPHRHNPHSHYKLNRNREQIKEKIENLTNPKYNLQHIKNGYYVDTNDKENTYKSIIDGDTISFRKTNIKILGYYMYKDIDEIKNKLVVF